MSNLPITMTSSPSNLPYPHNIVMDKLEELEKRLNNIERLLNDKHTP
jgi:hypothetical protein